MDYPPDRSIKSCVLVFHDALHRVGIGSFDLAGLLESLNEPINGFDYLVHSDWFVQALTLLNQVKGPTRRNPFEQLVPFLQLSKRLD